MALWIVCFFQNHPQFISVLMPTSHRHNSAYFLFIITLDLQVVLILKDATKNTSQNTRLGLASKFVLEEDEADQEGNGDLDFFIKLPIS